MHAFPSIPVREAIEHANSNAGRNVYLALDRERVLAEEAALASRFPDAQRRPLLYGVPVAIKDCFDVEGYPTTCGSRFYAAKNGIAQADSAVAARVRQAGAVIMGKTHLHQLAYGITGENSEYGDCLQPRDATLLTGGSSSGSVASVQEGSAVAAIGTDTGGSIRVPAALCGVAGYRSSLGLGGSQVWEGGFHLADSFDTLGWLFRDLRDGPALAAALLGVEVVAAPQNVTIAAVDESFLHDCEPAVLEMYRGWQDRLRRQGAVIHEFSPDFWRDAQEIFGGIQASEAADLHRGYFDHFETAIAERLAWGASRAAADVEGLRKRHAIFRAEMDRLLADHDFLILPCAPMTALRAGVDHSETRLKILRYTSPISLAGTPAVTLSAPGGGCSWSPRGAVMRGCSRSPPAWGEMIMRLALAACVCLLISGCNRQGAPSNGLIPVVLQTDWYPQPEHGGFYDAKMRGYYKDEGLEVTILPGGPYVNTAAELSVGKVQFAMASSDYTLQSIANGLPYVAVMATMQHDPQGLMVHQESSIHNFQDLDGHAIAIRLGLSTWFDYLVKRYQLHHVREIPATYSVANFLQDPGYIQQIFVTSEPFFARQAGAHVRTMLISETGYDPYRVVLTSRPFLEQNPQTVAKFVRASIRGWRDYLQHPDDINAAIGKLNPAMSTAQMQFSYDALRDQHFIDGGGPDLGKFTPARWASMYQQLLDLKVLSKPLDPASAYTLQFLPQ